MKEKLKDKINRFELENFKLKAEINELQNVLDTSTQIMINSFAEKILGLEEKVENRDIELSFYKANKIKKKENKVKECNLK